MGFTITCMNHLCSNFRCQIVRIVFKLNTRRDELVGVRATAFSSAALEATQGQIDDFLGGFAALMAV